MADKTITALQALAKGALDGSDELVLWNSEDGTTRKVTLNALTDDTREGIQGYFALLTNYYFAGGVATETEIAVEDINRTALVRLKQGIEDEGEFFPVNIPPKNNRPKEYDSGLSLDWSEMS